MADDKLSHRDQLWRYYGTLPPTISAEEAGELAAEAVGQKQCPNCKKLTSAERDPKCWLKGVCWWCAALLG